VRVAVDGDKSEQGFMVFADGVLVAVFSCLKETVESELQERWYLEAGFGPCDGVLPHPTFERQEQAEAWDHPSPLKRNSLRKARLRERTTSALAGYASR
jgi:hypothetical protein